MVGYTPVNMAQNVEELIVDVHASRKRVLEQLRSLTVEQGSWKPVPGQWSVAEIVEHLVLAEHAGINRIWQAADALKDRFERLAPGRFCPDRRL